MGKINVKLAAGLLAATTTITGLGSCSKNESKVEQEIDTSIVDTVEEKTNFIYNPQQECVVDTKMDKAYELLYGEESFTADRLYVLDTECASVQSKSDNAKRYYCLVDTKRKEMTGNSFGIYQDLLNEHGYALVSDNNLVCVYSDLSDDVTVASYLVTPDNALKSLEEFLMLNDFSDLILPSGEYTREDAEKLSRFINSFNEEYNR